MIEGMIAEMFAGIFGGVAMVIVVTFILGLVSLIGLIALIVWLSNRKPTGRT